jgi:hypothetical protein
MRAALGGHRAEERDHGRRERTVFAFSARCLAAAMRDRCGVGSDSGMRPMEPDQPESGVNGG